ncbi:MAG: class I SAM-dependent methyltransferase [Oscillospiraceae bacterium]|nr:class I SAM-dependent methyltransferase [Oscillospiraceae bacterium]
MNEWLKQIKDSWNKTADSDWYQSLRTDEKIEELVKNPANAFHPAVYQLINKYLPDLHGKKVLLPSSGDNHAAFAFALLGAEVTSADISEKQLEYAQEIANKLNLNICFVCDDTTQLSNIEDNDYDLVYTSNGTHTWIADIVTMYKNIYRVLKSTGYSIMFDIHPFNRPFTGEPWKEPKIIKSYEEIMPNCHWRVQDLVNAMIWAQLSIKEMEELQAANASFWFSYDELIKQAKEKLTKINNWNHNPMAALPAWISIVAQK